MENLITFFKMAKSGLPPMRADKSALGLLPTEAYQYCEPVRTASAYGWYIFPPTDVRLFWDGSDVFYAEDGEWIQLTKVHIDQEFVEHWDRYAPESARGLAPPYLTGLFAPGMIQIWSGLLIQTREGWSSLIAPPANLPQSQSYSCFEGIVETDRFCPVPLFINLRLTITQREILIRHDRPLFQVRPIMQETYSEAHLKKVEIKDFSTPETANEALSAEQWAGYLGTIRKDEPDEEHLPGRYAAKSRRLRRHHDKAAATD